MSNLLSNIDAIFQEIKGDFDSVWSLRDRETTKEIITPYSTLAGEFVSVFLTQRDNRYVISDGGKLHEIADEQDVSLRTRPRFHYADMLEKYAIKETIRAVDKKIFCYKTTLDIRMLSSFIYDVARFQEMVANSIFLETMFEEQEESREARYFATRVRRLLTEKARAFSTPNQKYELYRDDNVRFLKFTTGIRQVGTPNIWWGMTIPRSSMAVYERGVFSADCGFRHALKFFPSISGKMGAIVDVLPNDIRRNDRTDFLQNIMNGWQEDFHVPTLDYDRIVQAQDMKLFFGAA
jgi:hypothetical protein